jgi:NTE family protein
VEKGKLEDDRYTTVRFHQIGAEAELADLGAMSRMNTDPKFLKYLHDLGYNAADAWLEQNFDRIGWESTLDVISQYGSHDD